MIPSVINVIQAKTNPTLLYTDALINQNIYAMILADKRSHEMR